MSERKFSFVQQSSEFGNLKKGSLIIVKNILDLKQNFEYILH